MTIRNTGDRDERLTREEAALALKVSISTIDRYLADGTLPRRKLGKRLVRINRSDVDALVSTSTTPTAPSSGVSSSDPGGGASSSVEGAA